MKLRSYFFRRNGVLSAFAGSLLFVFASAANAQQCEPLTDTAGSPPSGLVTYQLPDLSGVDLLGRDGSRVRANTNASAPVLKRNGVQAPLPAQHWTNRADLAVYNDAKGKDKYLFLPNAGELRLCRIEHQEPEQGQSTIERFNYDEAGHLTGWQKLFNENGKWQVSGQRCFSYDAEGRLSSYADASEAIDCRQPKPEHIEAHYLHDNAGKLTRVIKYIPSVTRPTPAATAIVFDAHGTATHFVTKDQDGDPIQFPVTVEDLNNLVLSGGYITLKAENFEIVLAEMGLVESNSPWSIIQGEPDASSDDYLIQSANVHVVAEGETDGKGRVRLTKVQKKKIWSFVNDHPDRTCLMFYSRCLAIRAVYPADEWARCIDLQQRDPAACRAH